MIERSEALKTISENRGDAAMVLTMSVIQDWADLASPEGLDFHVGGAMGYASSFGLGVALSQPQRKVIVVDGDGSLLMNLGTLVTITETAPRNLIHLVMENGMYELTGGNTTPALGKYDMVGFARAAGIQKVYSFDDLAVLRERWEAILREEGPIFVSLRIAQGPAQPMYTQPPDQFRKFEAALQAG